MRPHTATAAQTPAAGYNAREDARAREYRRLTGEQCSRCGELLHGSDGNNPICAVCAWDAA